MPYAWRRILPEPVAGSPKSRRRGAGAAIAALISLGCGSEPAPDPEPIDPLAVIVPAETADDRSLAILGDWRNLPVPASGSYAEISSYDRGTSESSLVLLKNGNRDMNNFVCKSADAEAETLLVPPSYDLDSCPDDYVRGHVLARVDGPGRLARLELTMLSLRSKPADDEILRIWVDDRRRPLIQVPLASALDGTAGEIFAPPFGRGVSHVLIWYYPVSFAKRLVVALDRLGALDAIYYQVDVVADPSERAAKAARSPLRNAAAELLDSTAGPLSPDLLQPLLSATTLTLAPGETRTVADLSGPATVHRLGLGVAETDLTALEDVSLVVHWDDAPDAALSLPLAALFASSLGAPDAPSLPLASRVENATRQFELRLPMPFASHAVFELVSSAPAPLELELELDGESAVPSAFARLHAELHTTTGPTTLPAHPIVDTPGPGRYVGTCLMLEGHALADKIFGSPFNMLEGDARGVLDGQPKILGTGTEDYLNDAFYFEHGAFGFAFGQAYAVKALSPTAGQVSACRWHLLGDAIDFQQSFDFELEIGPGDPSLLDRYRSVAFFYR
jgi:Protein of unknown function (DUF2961)